MQQHSQPSRTPKRRPRRPALPLLELLEDRTLLDVGDTLTAALVTNLGPGSGTYTLAREVLGDGPATTRDVDLFRFQAPANSRLTARTVHPGVGGQANTVLRLFNAGGEQVAINNDCGQSIYSCLDVRLASAGLYYVGVSGNPNTDYDPTRSASGQVGATGDFRLELALATVATTTVLTSSANPSVSGQGVTLTAIVSSASGTPTGAVTFRDGATTLATVALANGRATFTTGSLTVGAHGLTAEYGGAGNWVPSTSSLLTQQVNRAASRVTLTSSANPSVLGQNVTFTAQAAAVAPGAGIPTGVMVFIHDDIEETVDLDASGRATFSIASLALGDRVIQAEYQGDERFLDAPIVELTQRVNQARTTTRLHSSGTPAFIDEQITFTATVATQAPGAGLPAGSVSFFHFGNPLTTVELDGAGQASHTISSLPLGTHEITAIFNGSPTHAGSNSDVFRQEVSRYLTNTAVTSSLNPSMFSQSITYRATVRTTQVGGIVSSGMVTFRAGNTVLGTGTVNAQGETSFTTAALTAGRHNITASYEGNGRYGPSASPALSQQVNGRLSTTTVRSLQDPSVFGQGVTFSATVTGEAGFGTPGGTVAFRAGDTTLGTAALNAAGTATFTTAALALGTHVVRAEYQGDTRFAVSTSTPINQRVGAAASSTVLASSGSPSLINTVVTFTATVAAVAPGSGTPTGTVTFRNGATTLGTANLAGDVARFTTSTLAFGAHNITAVFNGEARFTTSTSSALRQDVLYPSRITISAPATSVFGQTISITAQVAAQPPGVGRPTGTVTFRNGATVLGAAAINVNTGQAILNTSALGVGTHNLTAAYGGDASFFTSASSAASHRVNAAASQTGLVTSGSPSVFGQAVTFTATVNAVAPGAGTPAGTVTFRAGATNLATVNLTNGRATFTTANFGVGTTNVVAVFNGEARFTASTSNTVGQMVNRANTQTALTSSANPSVFGQPVVFTATVTAAAPGAGVPVGSVSFRNGATLLATVNLTNGRATFSIATLGVAAHNITATYNGEPRFNAGAAVNLSQRVNPAGTRTVVTSSENPSLLGAAVTFTATVSAVAPGSGTPTGNVTFRNGAAVLGTIALAGGVARLTTSALGQGTHQITATFNGEGRYAVSTSPNFAQQVFFRSTTALVSSANPAVFGQGVTFTATVTSPNGTPTGNVLFRDGATTLGRVALANGRATFTTSTLTVAAHSISANYEGDDRYAASSLALNQTINRANTSTVLTSSLNPTVFGQAVTFTATINVVAPGAGSPTGNVTFRVPAGAVLGTVNLTGNVARFTTTSLGVGVTNVVAVYNADPRFNASTSATVAQRVNAAATQTALVSSANPGVFGQSLTFTATVTPVAPGAGTPGGNVAFRNGATVLGTVNLVGGVARFTTAGLALGTHAITATFNGEARFTTSASAAVSQRVNPAGSVTVITSSANPSVFGQVVTLTAAVSAVAPGSGTPTGNVTFHEGATVLGTVALNASARAAINLPSLTVSLHGITATFNGEARFTTSTSAIFNQRVNPAATRTTVTAAPAATVFGQAVTFTATVAAVAPGAGTPTGTVQFRFGNNVMGSAAIGANARAVLTFTGLPAGLHSITAVYQGETRYAASTSAAVNYRVNPAATQTLLTSSLNPSVFGQPVTYTATVNVVAPGAGTPAGTVTFRAGATVLGTANLTGNRATLTTGGTPAGNQTITATYNATADFAASTSAGLAQRVNPAATRTLLVSSLGTTVFGQSVTFTATVESLPPGSGTPSGTVTFRSGATNLGTVNVTNGRAVFSTSTLAVGSHTMTALFNANASFAASTSAGLAHRVNAANTQTGLTVNINPSLVGQAVTFRAAVSAVAPGSGTPTGNVTFRNGATVLGTVALTNGVAQLATSALAQGTHTITATYNGEARYTTSASAGLTQRVFHGTTVALTRSANPTVFGQSVTFTATVNRAAGAGVPTGTVVFRDGNTVLATVNVAGNGTASFSTAAFSVGVHNMTAAYSGDARFAASTSAVVAQTVNRANTTTALVSSVQTTVYGQPTTFTATVRPVAPGAGVPAGTVQFRNGTAVLANVPLTNGVAQFTTSSLEVGAFNITAAFGGEGRFNASTSAVVVQRVNKASTRTALVSSFNPSLFGDTVTFTATASPVAPGAGTPGGTMTFRNGATVLATVNLAGGRASFTSATLAIGLHNITATYNGDARYLASAPDAVGQRVKSHTRTTLVTSLSPTVFGQAVTFTATVAAVAPGTGVPPGTVTFRDGATVLATVPLAAGQARFTTSALSVADHPITALYNGDVAYGNSTSAAVTQRVNRADTRTALASSAEPSVFGQPVTFTATVSAVAPGAGTPGGTITFRNGGTVVATVALDASGRAQFTTATLPVASHNLAATYGGSGSFNASASAAFTQRVNRAATSAAVASSAAPAVFGQGITFTVTVRAVAPGAGTPGGEVTFRDGATVLGTRTLNAAGQATLAISSLSVGGHGITTAYAGDGNFNAITSPVFNQQVNRASTTTTLTTSLYPSVFGQAITFTAAIQVVAPGAGRPGGTVAFLDGATQIGTGALNAQGLATFTTSTLSIGRHPITAVYQGDGNFANGTSAVLSQRVNRYAHGYAAQVQPFADTRIAGQPGAFVILNGPVDDVFAPVNLGNRRFNFHGTTYDTLYVSSNGLITFGRGSTVYTNEPLDDMPVEAALAPLWDDWTVRESRPAVWGRYVGNQLWIEWTDVRHNNPPSVSPRAVTFQAVLSLDTGLEYGNVVFNYHSLDTGNFAAQGATATVGLKAAGVQGDHRVLVSHNARTATVQSNRAILLTAEEYAPVETRTTLTSSANPQVFGQPLTFTAVVTALSGAAGIPGGRVTFRDGATVLGTATLDPSRRAVFATSTLTQGTHTITASYDGTGRFATSVSPELSQRIVGSLNLVVSALPMKTVAGVAQTITVSVVDADGNLVPDYRGTVTFTSSDAGAVLPAAYTFTEEDAGVHTFKAEVSLFRAGPQTVTVTDAASNLRITAAVQVDPAAASRFALSGVPAALPAGRDFGMTVTAFDPFGNRATGYRGTVIFTSSDKTALLPKAYTFTEEDAGVQTFGLALYRAGEQTVAVSDRDNGTIEGAAALRVTPLAAAYFEVLAAASVRAGAALEVTVIARDVYGNVATDYRGRVRFASSDARAILPDPYTFTAANTGFQYFYPGLLTAGLQSFEVRDTADGSLEGVVYTEVLPGPAAYFEVAAAAATPAGAALEVLVIARDLYGNLATDYRGRVRFASSDAQAILPAAYTFTAADGGVQVFYPGLFTAGLQSVEVRDAADDTLAAVVYSDVLPGAAAYFEIIAAASVQAGDGLEMLVVARDLYGNVATGYRGRVRFTSSDALAALPDVYTFTAADNGVQFFYAALYRAGLQSIEVRDTADGSLEALVYTEVLPGPAVAFQFLMPEGVVAGQPFDVFVVVVDLYDNVVTNYQGVVRFSSSDPLARLPADYRFTAADAGSRLFKDVILFTAGYHFVQVETVDVPTLYGGGYTLVDPAEAAYFLVQAPERVRAGQAFALTVSVYDAYGNLATNYRGTFNFGSTDLKALLPESYTFTAADAGSHTFQGLILITEGEQEISFSDEFGLEGVVILEVEPDGGGAPGGGPGGQGATPTPASSVPAARREPAPVEPFRPARTASALVDGWPFLTRKSVRWHMTFDWMNPDM